MLWSCSLPLTHKPCFLALFLPNGTSALQQHGRKAQSSGLLMNHAAALTPCPIGLHKSKIFLAALTRLCNSPELPSAADLRDCWWEAPKASTHAGTAAHVPFPGELLVYLL